MTSVDSKIQTMLGTLMLQSAVLQTQLEQAQARIAELEAVETKKQAKRNKPETPA